MALLFTKSKSKGLDQAVNEIYLNKALETHAHAQIKRKLVEIRFFY